MPALSKNRASGVDQGGTDVERMDRGNRVSTKEARGLLNPEPGSEVTARYRAFFINRSQK
jgi:hypothetical protein